MQKDAGHIDHSPPCPRARGPCPPHMRLLLQNLCTWLYLPHYIKKFIGIFDQFKAILKLNSKVGRFCEVTRRTDC